MGNDKQKVNMDIPNKERPKERTDDFKRDTNPARTNEIERHKEEQRTKEQSQADDKK